MLRFFMLSLGLFINTTSRAADNKCVADTTKALIYTEGVVHTRISFPGNPINELLETIDLKKGDVEEQLKALQDEQKSEAYARKIKAMMDKMTASEKQIMGKMMMAVLMSPLYATIYFDQEKALAKAYALTYTLESYMNSQQGNGKMVAQANDKSTAAAIKFTAASLDQAWQKESADAAHYDIQWLTVVEKVSGIPCKKVVYTRKKSVSTDQKLAYKLIVWYAPQVSKQINFAHPFYLDIPHGVLKIDVHYDTGGKNRMVYQATSIEQKKVSLTNFAMTDIQPVLDWNEDQVKASMSMLTVFMSQNMGKD
jgi:hypothetical protein